MSDKKTEGTRARCCWEVVAGIIPNQPIPEHTRRWVITGEYWERVNEMTDEEFAQAHPDGKSSYRVLTARSSASPERVAN
jgi:hypothetical protein